MKNPLTMPDEPQPLNITRADLVMTEGFGLEVDGRMKTVFPTLEAAQKRARDLKAEFPMLQVKVYDAAEKKFLPPETLPPQALPVFMKCLLSAFMLRDRFSCLAASESFPLGSREAGIGALRVRCSFSLR